MQNFKLLQKTTCCCPPPWGRQEATAELTVIYNKIIVFSRESEASLPGHTGTRMQHREQEANCWDFPYAETAQEGWASWRFYLKTSSDSVPPQQAGVKNPEQLPPVSPPQSQQAPLAAGAHKILGWLWGAPCLRSRRASAWSGAGCLLIPFPVVGKNREPPLGF